MAQQVITRGPSNGKSEIPPAWGVGEETIKQLGEIVKKTEGVVGQVLNKLLEASKLHPLWAGSLIIAVNDIAQHQVDFIHGTHTEYVCLTCAASTTTVSGSPGGTGAASSSQASFWTEVGHVLAIVSDPGQLILKIAGLVQQGILSTAQQATLTQSLGNHTVVPVQVPGIITSTAGLLIAGLVISQFGIDNAGAILEDITSVFSFVGKGNFNSSTTQTGITTLFESGAAPVTVPAEYSGG